MSLKAKIEAVIYASEEPVTLAQLVGLLGEEAQVELDRATAAQASLALADDDARAEAETVPGADDEVAGDAVAHGPDLSAAGDEEAVANERAMGEGPAIGGDETAANGATEAAEAAPGAAVGTSEPANDDKTVMNEAPAKAEKARAARLRAYFRRLLDELVAEYAAGDRGLEVREVAGGFRFATKPEYHDAVRGFVRSLKPPLKLTLQALETLAVVAYKQPVTAPEISEIRGVDSGGVLGSLISRKLITTAGRKQVIGRPILYKTTREFLLKFGLKDIGELPSIEEFEKMAGQMAEQEDIPMEDDVKQSAAETAEELGAETGQYVPYTSGGAPTDEVKDPGDKAGVDGRLPSLPPNYAADDAEDPSAQEAEIQRGE